MLTTHNTLSLKLHHLIPSSLHSLSSRRKHTRFVAMYMGLEITSSPTSSSLSSSPDHLAAGRASAPKRPAGRTKFRETRHPVYRGVRRRGNAGRWVCEVRVPGKRGARLWLGTYATAEAAARANDAAMLALGGRSATACLNFADSAWLVAVPCAPLSDLADVRRAAVEAVADFQRRQTANCTSATATQLVTSTAPAPTWSGSDNAGSSETSETSAHGELAAPLAMDSDMFGLDDLFPEMDMGTYYMSLAEALLIDPPPPASPTGAYWVDNGDCGEGGADFALWNY